jgi:hypothetical protein
MVIRADGRTGRPRTQTKKATRGRRVACSDFGSLPRKRGREYSSGVGIRVSEIAAGVLAVGSPQAAGCGVPS